MRVPSPLLTMATPSLHVETPVIDSAPLSQLLGCRVFLKLDNAQPSGSLPSLALALPDFPLLISPQLISPRTYFYSNLPKSECPPHPWSSRLPPLMPPHWPSSSSFRSFSLRFEFNRYSSFLFLAAVPLSSPSWPLLPPFFPLPRVFCQSPSDTVRFPSLLFAQGTCPPPPSHSS